MSKTTKWRNMKHEICRKTLFFVEFRILYKQCAENMRTKILLLLAFTKSVRRVRRPISPILDLPSQLRFKIILKMKCNTLPKK